MIVIVDNGKGANEISQFVRMQNKIVRPSEAASEKARAYRLHIYEVSSPIPLQLSRHQHFP